MKLVNFVNSVYCYIFRTCLLKEMIYLKYFTILSPESFVQTDIHIIIFFVNIKILLLYIFVCIVYFCLYCINMVETAIYGSLYIKVNSSLLKINLVIYQRHFFFVAQRLYSIVGAFLMKEGEGVGHLILYFHIKF